MNHVHICFSAADYKEFLDVDGVYYEPQMTKGHTRLFVYLKSTLTVFGGNPFTITATDEKKIPKPMLDGSM